MLNVFRTSYGLRIHASGHLDASDLEKFIPSLKEICDELKADDEPFGVITDLSQVTTFDSIIDEGVVKAQMLLENSGEKRAGIIYFSTAQLINFTDIMLLEHRVARRYICSDIYEDYEDRALNWIRDGIEP
jgi:hypothetical protein